MTPTHWYTMAVFLLVAYLVGVKYPSVGHTIFSKIGMGG